jgi:hypothetical protein
MSKRADISSKLLLQGPGKGEDINPGSTILQENPGAFIYRRTGGKNIINEKNPLALYFFRNAYPEGVSDISASFRAAQSRLGLGPNTPFQNMGSYPVPVFWEYFPAEQEGLVKASLTQPLYMQGNGED